LFYDGVIMPDHPQHRPGFPSTRWSLVIMARAADPEVRRRALDQLLRAYSPALITFLIVGPHRLPAEKAEEIVQGFLVDKVLERDLLAKADPSKGKLRSLVLRSLNNYLIDLIRQQKVHAQLPDGDELPAYPDSRTSTDDFDRAWAWQVLTKTLEQMRDECLANNRAHLWALFEARVVRPALEGAAPVDYESLIRRFNFSTPEQAANALVTAKRHFRRVLEAIVAKYAGDEEIESEICDLRAVLAAAGPLGLTGAADIAAPALPQNGNELREESSPSLWATMLDAKLHGDTLWSADERMQLLDHLLRQPLAVILNDLDDGIPLLLARAEAAKSGEPLTTLNDLFGHSSPPLELLNGIKRWARRAVRDDASYLPSELCSLIYFAAIAAALVRYDRRITKSDDTTLEFGFRRVLMQPWQCSSMNGLIAAAMQSLSNG
jgi:DNA-directed RNA polymerase specialized sigma24 family protein